jgi:hypothetical protein
VNSGTVLDAELLFWLRAAPRPLGSLFGSFSRREARSKGDQQPDGRVAHNQKLQNILGVDTGILATRVLRARKTRKLVRGNITRSGAEVGLADIPPSTFGSLLRVSSPLA